MKKILFVMMIMLGAFVHSSAQTTKAVPIANGCGTNSTFGKALGTAGMAADYVFSKKSFDAQKESCNQHDRDYYNGVDKAKADKDFYDRGDRIKAEATTAFGQSAYDNAQQSRKRSQELQPAWEKKNNMSLDSRNYKIIEED